MSKELGNLVKSKKRKTKQGQMVIGQQNFINELTGEIVPVTLIQKSVNTDFNFHKVWLEDLLNILNSFGNRKITILSYLLKIMRNEDNSLNFTIRSLSSDTGVSIQTCQTTITELIESNVIKRDKKIPSLYIFNPDLIVKGGSGKRNKILIEYINNDEKNDNEKKVSREVEKIIDVKESKINLIQK